MDEIVEEHILDGRSITVAWRGTSFRPPRYLVRQTSGVCITDDGFIVLVTKDGASWCLPGGHPETGESLEDAFIREVREEACATVMDLVYLRCSEVNDPGNPEGLPVNFQARFWARVKLDAFTPEYEITERRAVKPEEVIPILDWHPDEIIKEILNTALACDRRYMMKTE